MVVQIIRKNRFKMKHIEKSWYNISTNSCCGQNSIDVWWPWNGAYSIHLEAGPKRYGIGIASPYKVWQIYNGKYSSIRR